MENEYMYELMDVLVDNINGCTKYNDNDLLLDVVNDVVFLSIVC